MRKKARPAPLHLAVRSTGTSAKRDLRAFSKVTRGQVAPGSTAEDGPVKCIVIDHFSEYLRFGDPGQTIRSFQLATEVWQEFAVKHGAAVILPCQLPTRDEHTVTDAVSAVGSLQAVNAVFLVKRAAKQNRGTLVHVKEQVGLDANGFSFQLRNRTCVPAVVWDGLARDFRIYNAKVPEAPQHNVTSGPDTSAEQDCNADGARAVLP